MELVPRVDPDGAAAQAEVGDVVLQADVLRIVAKEKQPAAEERRKRDQQRQDPQAGREAKR